MIGEKTTRHRKKYERQGEEHGNDGDEPVTPRGRHDCLGDDKSRKPPKRIVTERPLKLGNDQRPEAALGCWKVFRVVHASKLTVSTAKCESKNFELISFKTMLFRENVDFNTYGAKIPRRDQATMDNSAAKTILFIDDDPIVLMAYRTSMAQAGYAVETARDGLEAMRQLALITPDVIILDLMLPKFNGVEIMGFIRGNPKLKNIPVIVLSTHSIIDSEGEPMLETAQRRLIKETCTPASMLEAIQEALTNARPI
jgi:CheY-like chemotaxis protein